MARASRPTERRRPRGVPPVRESRRRPIIVRRRAAWGRVLVLRRARTAASETSTKAQGEGPGNLDQCAPCGMQRSEVASCAVFGAMGGRCGMEQRATPTGGVLGWPCSWEAGFPPRGLGEQALTLGQRVFAEEAPRPLRPVSHLSWAPGTASTPQSDARLLVWNSDS